ncbi:hypothetical protein PR202_ga11266 [Eleusine coracana subsp. coracana]|uniref:PWWP domain-containing protein n=1 Tax=Eleusine coracana subsp. coracana TaxID=191504 RepID=A0AAV5C8M9_ELECO|nr:hypothetical protein PR202_ga11266 [Eleusine coracana subsp. coracana]
MSDPAAAGTMVPAADGGYAWPYGAPRFGEMVWAKVKSHPWWPGHVYSITLTNNVVVHSGHRDGLVLVAFFGDSSYGWFEPHEIVPYDDHLAEKIAEGLSTRGSFVAALAEAVDEINRRAALGLLCPCRNPRAFRPHPLDARYFLVDVPGFDTDAVYHPDQIAAARSQFVPRKAMDFLLDAAVTQRDSAEVAARTIPGIEMAGLFAAYRRTTFEEFDETYPQAFGLDPEKVRAEEEKAKAARAQRARPLLGKRKTPTEEAAPGPGRRRGGAGGAAARLMEKIVPGAVAMKAKSTKKDQYLLKRRDPPPAEPAHRPAPLPDAPPAQDDGPPGFGSDPPTPPLPGSTAEDEEFMLQRRAPPLEAPPPSAADGAAASDAAGPKKATKPKKARKREREEAAAGLGPSADAAAGGEPKKKKKKKKLPDMDGGAASDGLVAAGRGKPKVVVGDLDGLDLKQIVSDLPFASFNVNGAQPRISDTARSFVLAFRSKFYKKSYENDPPEESKKSLSLNKPSAAADGQPLKKKKLAMRPGGDPTMAGVKRAPSDRQEEMVVKKKAKLDKIKTLSAEKKAGGLEQKLAGAAAAARPAMKEIAAARKKEPAPAPRIKTPSPTALMMRFPLKSTLPSVASLKARFARFGPLDIDGIRVYWKSNMCRVIYRFKSDAETALKYARANAMFGQVDAQYHIKEVEKSGGEPLVFDAPPPRSDLRLMETAAFRPGTSGNGSPLPMSRAMPARLTAMGQQQPKSILKKSTDEGGSATREGARVKFMLDNTGDNKLEPPALPTSGGGGNGVDSGAPVRGAKSVGFAPQPALQPPARTLQPPMRPTQQQFQPPPRAPVITQPLPPPPPLSYQARTSEGPQGQQMPYPPRHTDGPLAFSTQPSQQLPYPPRHNDGGMSMLPSGQPPLPYQPRSAGFSGHQQQQPPPYPPRNGDSPPVLSGQPQQHFPPRPATAAATDDVPAWMRSKEEFRAEVWRVMTGIAKLVEPLTDKNGFFPYHLFAQRD